MKPEGSTTITIIELRLKQGEVFLISFIEQKRNTKSWVYIAKAIQAYLRKYQSPSSLRKKMRHHKCINIERCCRFRYILHFSYEKFQFVSHCLFPHSKTGSEITFFMRVPWAIKIFSNRHVVNISRQKVRSLPLSIRYKKAKVFRSLFTSKIFLFGNKLQPSVHERKKIPRTFRC